jgi:cytochrome b6-f complex iron-sulfur subunit
MLTAAIVVIGVLLLAALVLAAARRKDTGQAVGVLSRETRKRDRSDAGLGPLADEAPPLTGRQVERQAARDRAGVERPGGAGGGTGTAVLIAGSRAPVPAAPPAPIDMEALGVTRRQFLNRAALGVFGVSAAGFGTAMVAFLWPTLQAGGFGSVINIGKVTDINATIATRQPFYSPQARSYINPYPLISVPKAKSAGGAYADPVIEGMQLGYVALYQKCVHLGCRVPWCLSSQWFECPCHGSQYNRVGEKKGGPAPRGLDRFALSISDGNMSVNTETVYVGPPIGTNTTGQEAEGPHCR